MLRQFFATLAERWFNPYKRYRYHRLIHAVRLSAAVLLATLIGRGFQLPHSEWISITVFVVLGMLQFQGAIYAKAFERLLGTFIGLGAGLLLLWLNQHYLHNGSLFYLAIALLSAFAGWSALGKSGYMAMLAGLTMCMLLGEEGSNWLGGSMMRALNVVIGASIALAAARLVPLKSTLMWRFMLSDNLTACSRQLAELTSGKAVGRQRWFALLEQQKAINTRLVKSRPLLAATSQESKISKGVMESIQHSHRTIVSSIDLLLHAVPTLPKPRISPDEEKLLAQHFFSLQHDLRLTAHLLKGSYARHFQPDAGSEEAIRALAAKLPFEWQGFIWLSLNIRLELFTLVTLLQHSRERWLGRRERQRYHAKSHGHSGHPNQTA
ncbi:FUSC family protein [Uruburuella testudinis]|uniref:FUSC family protein n=1 Tax=Uruburuella testudinis TaxID=1282863 RepID=A0ABY4DW93_9NEIS|nr:FUSC family protein [Uruburuella testudinis]UOO83290.1 FUSC family protein [Uruburuella testudinis]